MEDTFPSLSKLPIPKFKFLPLFVKNVDAIPFDPFTNFQNYVNLEL